MIPKKSQQTSIESSSTTKKLCKCGAEIKGNYGDRCEDCYVASPYYDLYGHTYRDDSRKVSNQ